MAAMTPEAELIRELDVLAQELRGLREDVERLLRQIPVPSPPDQPKPMKPTRLRIVADHERKAA